MHAALLLIGLLGPLAEPPGELIEGVRIVRGSLEPPEGSLLRVSDIDPADLLIFGAKVYGQSFIQIGPLPTEPVSLELRHLEPELGFQTVGQVLGLDVALHPAPKVRKAKKKAAVRPKKKAKRKPKKKKALRYPKQPLLLLTAGQSPLVDWKDLGPDKKTVRISVAARNVSLRDLMALIGRETGVPHVVHQEVKGTLTLHVEDLPAGILAEAVARGFALERRCFGKGKGAACVIGPRGMDPVGFRLDRKRKVAKPAKVAGLKQKMQLVLDGATPAGLAKLATLALGKRSKLVGVEGRPLTLKAQPTGKQSLRDLVATLATANELVVLKRAEGIFFGTRDAVLEEPPGAAEESEAPEQKVVATLVMKRKGFALADNGRALKVGDTFAGCPIVEIASFVVAAQCDGERKEFRITAPATPSDMVPESQVEAWVAGRKLSGTFIGPERRLGLISHPQLGPHVLGLGDNTFAEELIDWIDSGRLDLFKDGQRAELKL